MEASATTENINTEPVYVDPETGLPINRHTGKPVHDHKPNYGRYVAGCNACVLKYPDGPPAKRLRAKPGHKHDAVRDETNSTVEAMPMKVPHAITGDQLIDALRMLMSGQDESRKNELIAFAQELKKPDPEELAKKEAEKARRAENRAQMIQMIQEGDAKRLAQQAMCERYGHKKENGRSGISGQVHSDGLLHLLCVRCNKQFPGVKPDQEHMPTGISVM